MTSFSAVLTPLSWQARTTHPLLYWATVCSWVFIALQFVLGSNLLYAWWFYLAVGLPLIALLVQTPPLLVGLLRDRLLRLCMYLFGYTLLHTFVLLPEQAHVSDTLRHSCATLIFVLAMVLACQVPAPVVLRWLRVLLMLTLATAILAIVWHVGAGNIQERLQAFGQNDHPILGANIMAMMALMGMVFLHPQARHICSPRLVVVTLCVVTLLIILTQSRGPLLSFAVTFMVGLWMTRCYRVLAVIAALAAALLLDYGMYYYMDAALLPFDGVYASVEDMFGRESHRLGIWKTALGLIERHPLFGYGMQAVFPYSYGGVNPHNLFLSAWFYTGILGAAFLVVITLIALLRAGAIRRDGPLGLLAMLWMVHAIAACMTDQGQYVNSPSPLWSIYWLPVAFVIARTSPSVIDDKMVIK